MHYSRRSVLGVSLGLGATALIARSSMAQEGTPAASPIAGGPWSMVDGRGQTVEAETTPVNIIAQTISGASLWDFGVNVVGIYGDEIPAESAPTSQFGGLDPAKVQVLGTWASGLDLEAALAVGADLFVDIGRSEDGALWSITPEVEADLLAFCPTFSIKVFQKLPSETIADFEALAASLGADLDAPEIAAAKAGFAEKETAFKAAIAANPDLKVLILTGDPTTSAFFVSSVNGGGIGGYMLAQGVKMIEPENLDPAQLNIFETVSWEEVGKYPADVILYDARFDPSVFADDPLWSALPAVQVGQVGPWHGTFPYSYQRFNAVLDDMIATVTTAKVVV